MAILLTGSKIIYHLFFRCCSRLAFLSLSKHFPLQCGCLCTCLLVIFPQGLLWRSSCLNLYWTSNTQRGSGQTGSRKYMESHWSGERSLTAIETLQDISKWVCLLSFNVSIHILFNVYLNVPLCVPKYIWMYRFACTYFRCRCTVFQHAIEFLCLAWVCLELQKSFKPKSWSSLQVVRTEARLPCMEGEPKVLMMDVSMSLLWIKYIRIVLVQSYILPSTAPYILSPCKPAQTLQPWFKLYVYQCTQQWHNKVYIDVYIDVQIDNLVGIGVSSS